MLNVIDLRDAFELRVLDDELRDERLVQRDVNVFVDGRRDEEAAEAFVVGRQIRAAAAEADAKW